MTSERQYIIDNWGISSAKTIAEKLCRSENAVRDQARKLGVRKRVKAKPVPQVEREEMRRMFLEGNSVKKINEKFPQYVRSTVWRYANGIER